MSKLIFNKKCFIKQISNLNKENNNINKNIENIIGNSQKDVPFLNNNNINKNDITLEIQKHYSPPSLRSPILLPKIQNPFKKVNNSQKKINPKIITGANSFANLNHPSIFGIPQSKLMKKDKTQISILENQKVNNNKLLQNNSEVQQINNITNINIHIYSNNKSNSNQADDNLKNDMIKTKLNITNNNISLTPINNKQNEEKVNNEINNTINNIENINNRDNKNIIFSYKYKKKEKNNNKIIGNIKLISPFPFNASFDKNNNNKSLFNYNIRNNEKEISLSTKKYLSNSLPDININKDRIPFLEPKNNKLNSIGEKILNNSLDKKNNKNNIIKDDDENNNNNLELNNIDTSMNFLRDINSDTTIFVLFLKLIQNHIDIAILIDNAESSKGSFRKKASNILNTEVICKLNALLNSFFNILTVIYNNKDNHATINNKVSKFPNDCFFLFSSLNNIFHKIIKIQICLYSSILVTSTQLGQFDLSNMMKNYFNIIIKEITSPLLYFFDFFIKEDINLNYPDLIKNHLKSDFLEHINKLNKNKKKQNFKNSEILLIIIKNINKAFDSMKNYLIINLKYSLIKPFGDAVLQMITSLEKRSLYQFVSTFLKTILFGELEINKKKVIQNSLNCKNKFQNVKQTNNKNKILYFNNYCGSSYINNVREIPPFLPPIYQKYKYTLVLDMDETLVHFFFTHTNGMFFVRPYCFEFLNELNNLYEIVTFTAGTKEYADNILNQLDINDNIIKFRLYRQHITIMGFNVYKDLNKLGRDLSKIIIIDNLKENFKMQPNNGIFIKTWTSDVNDKQFKDLLQILKDIANFNVDDVRPVIQKMNEEIKKNGSLINPYSSINIQKIIEDNNNLIK